MSIVRTRTNVDVNWQLARTSTFLLVLSGLWPTFEDAGYAEFATQGTRFALYEKRRAAWLTGRELRPRPAAEVVFIVDDVDAQSDRLAALGAPIISGSTDCPWGHRTVHTENPVSVAMRKVPTGGQVGVSAGGLVEVPLPGSSSRPGGWALGGDGGGC